MKLLGDLSPDQFLAEYWQRKPLLVRNALKNFRSPLSSDELAGLAMEPEVESRLVAARSAEFIWELRQGPFTERDFAALPESNWSLLVQAVDLWVPEVNELVGLFDFIPRWRLDDLMVSFATPGGGVGPHVDQYDVFLIQIEGERDWRIGTQAPGEQVQRPGTPLRVMENFETLDQWVLGPGDMLYLPPSVPHWGVAKTDCMTYSVGFRSPSASEMLGDLAVEVLARNTDPQYRDPPFTTAMAGEAIAPEFVQSAKALLMNLLDDDELLADWFARFMTAPKYPGLEELTRERRRAIARGIYYENGEAISRRAK